jgi:predicted P-loop ATPase/GTPase
MAAVILVAGLVPFDSGKTWFALGAALAARERGLRVGVFKPVAAHNLWYSPRAVRKSLELKLLVGNDVLLYREKGLVEDIGVSNPVAVATAPPDPSAYASVGDYMRDFEDVGRIAVLSRVYAFDERAHSHYVHAENLRKMGARVRRLVEKMGGALGAAPRSFAGLSAYLTSNEVAANLDKCLRELERGRDLVFVESFNDAVAPYGALLESVDAAVIVAPGKAYVYRDARKLREVSRKAFERWGVGWLPHQLRFRLVETRLLGGNRLRRQTLCAQAAQGVHRQNRQPRSAIKAKLTRVAQHGGQLQARRAVFAAGAHAWTTSRQRCTRKSLFFTDPRSLNL